MHRGPLVTRDKIMVGEELLILPGIGVSFQLNLPV
jgi:hypothetical protein